MSKGTGSTVRHGEIEGRGGKSLNHRWGGGLPFFLLVQRAF